MNVSSISREGNFSAMSRSMRMRKLELLVCLAVACGSVHASVLPGISSLHGAGRIAAGAAREDELDASSKQPLALVEKRAEAGIAAAQNELGDRYRTGRSVGAKNLTLALSWYRKAAEQGYALAQYSIGTLYEDGDGVKEDDEQALSWYLQAANQGLSKAQDKVGSLYEEGKGTSPDTAMARLWFHKAADQNDAEAEYRLGRLYELGEGGVADNAQAMSWYEKSAQNGCALAQYSLGLRYMQGLVIPQNKQTARMWLQKAADQGNEDAKRLLALLPAPTAQAAVTAQPDADQHADPVQQALDMLVQENGLAPRKPAAGSDTASNHDAPAQSAAVITDPVQQALAMLEQPTAPAATQATPTTQTAPKAAAPEGSASSAPVSAAAPSAAPPINTTPRELPPVLGGSSSSADLTGYAAIPDSTLPEPSGGGHMIDKNSLKAIRICNTPTQKLKNDRTRNEMAAGCLTAAKYFQNQQDDADTKTAYQKSCAYGVAEACIEFGSYLNGTGDTKSGLNIWNYGVGCHSNQQCVETIFQYYASASPPDKSELNFYGHDLCENQLEMGICKTLADAGLPIDYDQIAARKKANEIADLKTRINALEDEAQSDDIAAAGSQAASDHVSGALPMGGLLSFAAGKAATSSADAAAKARADAAALRQQLIALQGNDDGAKPKGPSVLGAAITGVSAGVSSLASNPGNTVLATAVGMKAMADQLSAGSGGSAAGNETGSGSQAPPLQASAAKTFSYSISFAGSGSAHITSSPVGIDCPGVCSFTWNADPSQQLLLTVTNAPGVTSSIPSCSETPGSAPDTPYTCNIGPMAEGSANLTVNLQSAAK